MLQKAVVVVGFSLVCALATWTQAVEQKPQEEKSPYIGYVVAIRPDSIVVSNVPPQVAPTDAQGKEQSFQVKRDPSKPMGGAWTAAPTQAADARTGTAADPASKPKQDPPKADPAPAAADTGAKAGDGKEPVLRFVAAGAKGSADGAGSGATEFREFLASATLPDRDMLKVGMKVSVQFHKRGDDRVVDKVETVK